MSTPKDLVYCAMKRLFKSYIRGCRRRNIFFELTLEQFHKLTSAPCYYCNKKPAQKSRQYTYNGIDRMDSKRGYCLGNILTACKECNWIKGDRLTVAEMKTVAQALIKFRREAK